MILCADDYGFRDDINAAILELARLGKLRAVSCMVSLQRCDRAGMESLLALEGGLDVGLHLCLTDEGLPLSVPGPRSGTAKSLPDYGVLLRRSLWRQIQPQSIVSEISLQYELFVQKCRRTPDYIDGHLHIHQLPTIRQALVDFVLSLPAADRPYIRNTHLPVRELRRRKLPWFKAAFINAFGQRLLGLLQKNGLRTNAGFAGIYDFRNWRKYPDYWPRFLACLGGGNGILVVHPGATEDWRRQEFETIRDFAFPPDLLNRFVESTQAEVSSTFGPVSDRER